jgi:two-component system sensor histidine kinase CpxA
VERSSDPDAWWFGIRLPLPQADGNATLVLRTGSLSAGGLLPDFTSWLWGAAGLLVLSSLLWLPFVRGVTRHISKMKLATARIAEGGFDVHVPDNRRDELGELAAGINRMASRLSGFVTGQKRFLGDIAHELCTPLARIQMAGAALEQRAPAEMKERIRDLTVEIEAMSQLTAELLDFSRAGIAPHLVALTPVPLLSLIEQAAVREGVAPDRLELAVSPNLFVKANHGLFLRAVGNVMRNSLRHAGPSPKLKIDAQQAGNEVVMTLSDDGPGVPESALPSLFDPFFRLDPSRDRSSGGTGLGLAIVKTCIESCGGSVTARNRPEGGLEVSFQLLGAS